MEVKIISEELIKPSSSTPQHLRTFKLSLLGQLVLEPYVAATLFYSSNSKEGSCLDVRVKIDLLKKSLSQTLSRFYPLAGKIRDDFTVECDDGGARFVEVNVNMSLSQFLTDPDLIMLNKFLPCEYAAKNSPDDVTHAANFQVNVFQCGGMAISLCNPHKLHDGAFLSALLKEWAAAARGGGSGKGGTATAGDLMAPAEVFPVKDLWLRDLSVATLGCTYKKGRCVTQRFLFSGPAIEALKARGTGPTMKKPTRVEAVSGFLWKCAMAASKRKSNGLRRPSVFLHFVGIHRKTDPALSEFSLGNLLWVAAAQCKNTDSDCTDDMLPLLVAEMRRAISKIDSDFVSGLRNDKNLISSSLEELRGLGSDGEVDCFGCSSWCNFGAYNVNFGWGRPVWVGNIGFNTPMFQNFIFLFSTRLGNGIEAWVTLGEEVMDLLQEDPELRSFATVNPCPLAMTSLL
ncbi:hypothetical protein CRG98_024416 [Punica granatum]|nr:hypothetical protein CRG98_024416 [Punica granatum]